MNRSLLYFTFQGNNIVFVYPDLATVLVGQFYNGIMISASPAEIKATRCNNGLKEIETSATKKSTSMYTYLKPTPHIITNQPTLEDPLELKNVFVSMSKIVSNEMGLYARKNFEIGQVLAYYSGILWNTTAEELLPTDFSDVHL